MEKFTGKLQPASEDNQTWEEDGFELFRENTTGQLKRMSLEQAFSCQQKLFQVTINGRMNQIQPSSTSPICFSSEMNTSSVAYTPAPSPISGNFESATDAIPNRTGQGKSNYGEETNLNEVAIGPTPWKILSEEQVDSSTGGLFDIKNSNGIKHQQIPEAEDLFCRMLVAHLRKMPRNQSLLCLKKLVEVMLIEVQLSSSLSSPRPPMGIYPSPSSALPVDIFSTSSPFPTLATDNPALLPPFEGTFTPKACGLVSPTDLRRIEEALDELLLQL